jgi:hypothetical protein
MLVFVIVPAEKLIWVTGFVLRVISLTSELVVPPKYPVPVSLRALRAAFRVLSEWNPHAQRGF